MGVLIQGCKQRRATLIRRVLTDAQWAIISTGRTLFDGIGGPPDWSNGLYHIECVEAQVYLRLSILPIGWVQSLEIGKTC